MSDELQIITTNAASDGWVDGVPGAVSTGYQAQNTALQALFNGVDKSSCSVSGANLVIAAGGLIDDSGLPFVITEAITLALPTTGAANWFLRVVPGSTALERSIEFTDDRGTYDAAKNGFYDSDGYRALNWLYARYEKKLIRLTEYAENIGYGGVFPSRVGYSTYGNTQAFSYANFLSTITHGTTMGIGIAYNPVTDYIYYADGTNQKKIWVVDHSGAAVTSITTAFDISGIAIDIKNQNLILTSSDLTTAYIMVGFTSTVLSSFAVVGGSEIEVISEDSILICVSFSSMRLYNFTGTLLNTITLPENHNGVCYDSINKYIIVASVITQTKYSFYKYNSYSDIVFLTIMYRNYTDQIQGISFDEKRGQIIGSSSIDDIIRVMGMNSSNYE